MFFPKIPLSIHGDKECFLPKMCWSYFWSKLVKKGQILVRYSGKIGQIVSHILENFSQILLISTLHILLQCPQAPSGWLRP